MFRKDITKALDILSDILQNSLLEESAIERERGVILREKEEIEKQTDEVVFDHLHAIAFPRSSLGLTILGSDHNINTLKRSDLVSYIRSNYLAPRMVLAGAGAIDHVELCENAEKLFSQLPRSGPGSSLKPLGPAEFIGAEMRHRDDTTPLAHVAIALQGASWTSPDYFPLLVAQAIVGNWNRGQAGTGSAISGRLASVISAADLAQSFMSFCTSYTDTGLFGIYLVSDRLKKMDELVYEVQQEWVRICLSASEAEVARAKMQLKAAVLINLDGTTAICDDIGRQVLIYGRRFDWNEVHQMIDSVDTKTVRQVATEYLYDRCPSVVAIGNIGGVPDYARIRAATSWLRN